MLLEQLIFIALAFALFVVMFYKMIKNNDTSYVGIIILEAIGIAISFIEVLLNIELNIVFVIIKYVLAILLPIIIIIIEKTGTKLMEMINYAKAKVYLFMGNNKAAKTSLINIVSKYEKSYKAHKLLAEIYEQEGGMRKSIDEYVQAIDIDKKDYDSYYKVANLLNQLDKKDEASEMLVNLLQKKPEYTAASELLGTILIDKQKYKEAANVYLDALRYDELNYDLNYNLGIAYTMLNDFQSAKTYYEKAAEINSLAYNSKYSLAEIALIYKELDEAEKRFMEVLEEENSDLEADSYFELSKINLIRGEKDKAINYANVAIESDPKRIVKKIKNEPIFIPILAKLTIPINLDNMEEKKITKLTDRELRTKKYLQEMVDITRNLSYNDIRLLKKDPSKRKVEEVQEGWDSNWNYNCNAQIVFGYVGE